MAAFRFRAQAALDLRQRELDDAERNLARAQQDSRTAAARVDQAESEYKAAQDALTEVTKRATTVIELERHRYWIIRLDHQRRECRAILATCETVVQKAVEACRTALRRCKSLERFRDMARTRHEAAEAAAERKAIDELAMRRFAATRAREGMRP